MIATFLHRVHGQFLAASSTTLRYGLDFSGAPIWKGEVFEPTVIYPLCHACREIRCEPVVGLSWDRDRQAGPYVGAGAEVGEPSRARCIRAA